LFTYKWGRAAFNRNVGLGGAALAAVGFWPTMTSRFALNSNPAPALFTAAVWLMWEALFGRPVRSSLTSLRYGALRETSQVFVWLGFSLCLAASLYTYEASRGAWLALPAFLLFLLFPVSFISPLVRRRLWSLAVALSFGTALALPHLLDASAWGRTSTLSGPIASALSGDFGPFLRNAGEALGAIFLKGDPFIVYNIPGRPILDLITATLALGGVFWCLWHWRRPEAVFTLLWFGAGFAPAMAVGAFTTTLHAITAQAVVFVLPAVCVDRLVGLFHRRARRDRRENELNKLGALRDLGGKTFWLGFVVLVAVTALATFRDYFDTWANATDTRAAYFSNFRGVMDTLRSTSFTGSVTLSSPFPGLPHDPLALDLHVRRADLDYRWFDAREAIVFPPTDSSLLVLPVNSWPDAMFAPHLPLSMALRHIVRETDVDPYFDTVVWNPKQALNEWLAVGSLTRIDPPANFGGAVELIAFQINPHTSTPPNSLAALTLWRILDPSALGPRQPANYAPEARLFVQLLDADGNYVTGVDRLDAPAWNWHSGDTFAQIHRLTFPPDLAPGNYELRTGLYTLPDLTRLTGPNYDSYSLGTIAITRP